MIRKKKGDIEWLEFELLANEPGLKHGVFLRHGGVSPSPYDSLNAGAGTEDALPNIQENLDRIRKALDLPSLVKAKQSHSINIVQINTPDQKEECDGLISTQNNIALAIRHADCQAAIFYDRKRRLIANIHCGWRGNVQNIYRHAIDKLQSDPKDLLVCISPSLGPDASEFKNFRLELPDSFLPYQFKPTYFNLWEISRDQLLNLGIPSSNIQIASICTYSNPSDFFSYRREKNSGRNATIVALV